MGITNYYGRQNSKIFFLYYFVYALFFTASIYLGKIVLRWRNEFISENCNVAFRGFIYRYSFTIINY